MLWQGQDRIRLVPRRTLESRVSLLWLATAEIFFSCRSTNVEYEGVNSLYLPLHERQSNSPEKILIKMHKTRKAIGNGIADSRGGFGPAVGATTLIYMTGEL